MPSDGLMSFFNLRSSRTRNRVRRKKKDYHQSSYSKPYPVEKGSPAKRISKKLVLYACIVGIPVSALYWVMFSGAFSVDFIEVGGAERTPVEEIKRAASVVLNRRRYFILNQHESLFAVDREHLRMRLGEEFALGAVRVEPKLPHTLFIYAQDRAPAYAVKDRSGATALIDADGVIVTTASGDAVVARTLLTLHIASLENTRAGQRMFDDTAMKFLHEVQEAVSGITRGYRIHSLDLERVLVHDITAHTNEQWVIYMTDTIAPKLQFLNVDRALAEMNEAREKINYIDVRLPTKIFYK